MLYNLFTCNFRSKSPVLLALIVAAAVLATVAVVLLPAKEAEAAFPGYNGKIAFVSNRDGNFDIYAIDPDGTNLSRLTNHPANERQPTWSPDGSKIAFQSNRDGNWGIYVMDSNGSNVTRLTNHPADNISPSWLPDGARIAFIGDRETRFDSGGYPAATYTEIYTMDATDGSDVARVTNVNQQTNPDDYVWWKFTSLAWSPDGSKIAFGRHYEISEDEDYIFTMNVDSSGEAVVGSGYAYDPEWSPDGSKVAHTLRWDSEEIIVTDANGANRTNLTATDQTGEMQPAWSPDGSRMAFVGGDLDIYTMDAAGGSERIPLTTGAARDLDPDWQPLDAPPPPPSPDTTAPSIHIGAPQDSATYVRNQRVKAEYSCQDEIGGSGMMSCEGPVPSGSTIDTALAGLHTFTVTAKDYAGNTSSVTHSYTVSESECTITGTQGNDVLDGTQGDDTICGLGGRDTIKGFGGNDILRGERGNDKLYGGEGDDALDGGGGTDGVDFSSSLSGVVASLLTNTASGEGSDTLTSIESLLGSRYADQLTGSAKINDLYGASGADTLLGLEGADTLSGGPGNDHLRGATGNDKLKGGAGADDLLGEEDDDTLDSQDGVSGNDSLDGGTGTNSCTTDATESSIVNCQ